MTGRMTGQRGRWLVRWRGMKPLILLMPLAVLAACSPDPAPNGAVENEVVPPDESSDPVPLPDPVPTPLPPPLPSPVVDGAIPARFHGTWSATAAGCGRAGDDSRLTVGPGELRFYESIAEVTDVTGTDAAIRVTARFSGEGEQWTETRSLTLSPNGRTLRADGMTRVRCG